MRRLLYCALALALVIITGCRNKLVPPQTSISAVSDAQQPPIENTQEELTRVLAQFSEDTVGIVLDGEKQIIKKNFAIGPCVMFNYSEYNPASIENRPIEYEIHYPQMYFPNEYDSLPSRTNRVNQLLLETAFSAIPRKTFVGLGYVDYDITYATEDIVSICFYSRIDSGPSMPYYGVSAITIDLETGEPKVLSDFLDSGTFEDQLKAGEYDLLHKNSFLYELYIDEMELIEKFLEDKDHIHDFFLSDKSKSGVFIIFRTIQEYIIWGTR